MEWTLKLKEQGVETPALVLEDKNKGHHGVVIATRFLYPLASTEGSWDRSHTKELNAFTLKSMRMCQVAPELMKLARMVDALEDIERIGPGMMAELKDIARKAIETADNDEGYEGY